MRSKNAVNGLRLISRWSLNTSGVIAAIWIFQYILAGTIPSVRTIGLTDNWKIDLAFPISRWWDVLLGPIGAAMLIPILTNKRGAVTGDQKLPVLITAMVIGLACGAAVGFVLAFEQNPCLITTGAAVGLLFGLGVGCFTLGVFGCDFIFGQTLGIVFGLSIGLGCGVTSGLLAGVIFGISASAYIELLTIAILTVGTCLKFIFSAEFWRSIRNTLPW